MNRKLLAIYDFSVFPYALGDLTTWYIQKNCEAINLNYNEILFILLSSNRINLYQNKNLLKERQRILNDLSSIPKYLQIKNKVKIIYNNKMLNQLISDKSLISDPINKKILEAVINKKNNNNLVDFLLDPKSIHYRTTTFLYRSITPLSLRKIITPIFKLPFIKYLESRQNINDFMSNVASHRNLNNFFKNNKYFPFLKNNKKNNNKNNIAIQFRFRQLDTKTFGHDSIERDASIITWSLVINLFNFFFPYEKIYLLGRPEEKPPFLIANKKIYIRNKDQSLIDDLRYMFNSSIFLGSSSGFAAVANFSELPYLITKVNENAKKNYDIPISKNKLPFAKSNQVLKENEDPLEIMSFYCKIKKKDFSIIRNYFKNQFKLFSQIKNKESFILDNPVIKNNNFFINEYLVNSKTKDVSLFYLYLICTLNQ